MQVKNDLDTCNYSFLKRGQNYFKEFRQVTDDLNISKLLFRHFR